MRLPGVFLPENRMGIGLPGECAMKPWTAPKRFTFTDVNGFHNWYIVTSCV